MKCVWKFPLEFKTTQVVEMPGGADLLAVEAQRGVPCLWALVDPEAVREKRHILLVGTGHVINGTNIQKYIGTFQLDGGALVFHAFEIPGF